MSDVTPGIESSEYQLTNRASWIGVALMVLGVVVEVAQALVDSLAPIAAQFPDVKWLGTVLLVAGAIVKVATLVGYQSSRAKVKAAASTGAKALLLAFVLSGSASAQELSPKFGGCLGSTCFAPAVNVNVIAMSLRNGDLISTFDPGLGYGVTFFSDKWHKVGLSSTASFPQFDGKRRVEPALMASFAEYVRIGVSCPLYVAGGFQENGRLLFGFGADFGSW